MLMRLPDPDPMPVSWSEELITDDLESRDEIEEDATALLRGKLGLSTS